MTTAWTALREELRSRADWLLIFDNADTATTLSRWLPPGAGHTLITSRDPVWAELAVPIEVTVLPRTESVELLQLRAPKLEEPMANRLAAALGDHPLALA